MARITGGSARYLRRVNTGNYEHKEFDAVISWSADDGDNPLAVEEMIERAADTAIGVVHQGLGLTPEPERTEHRSEMDERAGALAVIKAQAIEAKSAMQEDGEAASRAAVEEKAKQHRATKAEMEARRAAPAGIAAEEAQAAAEARARISAGAFETVSAAMAKAVVHTADPLADEGQADPLAEAASAESGLSAAASPFTGASALVTTPDPLADDDLLALPPDISNEDLVRAAEKKKVELGDAIKIRQTLGRYAQQMSMIPQERRRAFLDELEALK